MHNTTNEIASLRTRKWNSVDRTYLYVAEVGSEDGPRKDIEFIEVESMFSSHWSLRSVDFI